MTTAVDEYIKRHGLAKVLKLIGHTCSLNADYIERGGHLIVYSNAFTQVTLEGSRPEHRAIAQDAAARYKLKQASSDAKVLATVERPDGVTLTIYSGERPN